MRRIGPNLAMLLGSVLVFQALLVPLHGGQGGESSENVNCDENNVIGKQTINCNGTSKAACIKCTKNDPLTEGEKVSGNVDEGGYVNGTAFFDCGTKQVGKCDGNGRCLNYGPGGACNALKQYLKQRGPGDPGLL